MRMRVAWQLVLIGLLQFLPAFAVSADLDVAGLGPGGARASVAAALGWWPRAPADADLGAVLAATADFTPVPGPPGYGTRDGPLWFRLNLVNSGKTGIDVVAEAGFSNLDVVEAWLVRRDHRAMAWKTGQALPWSSRPLGSARFAFPFALAAGERATLLLRVRSSTVLMLPLSVYEMPEFVRESTARHAWQGVFYGLALGLMAYALLFRAVREIAFVYYITGCLLGLWYFLAIDGFLPALLPDSPGVVQWMTFFGGTASVACILMFSRHFLMLDRSAPRLDALMRGVALIALLAATLVPLLPPRVAMLQMIGLSISMAGLITAAGVVSLRAGFSPARWLLVAIAVHLAVLVLVALGALAIFPTLFDYADFAHRLGFVLNLACFTMAIGDRIRLMEQEGRQARDRALAAAADLRARNEFMSRMSHELRTPMTGVLGMAELLEGTSLESSQRRYLSALRYSAEMLLNLINDILDHVRLQAGTLRLGSGAFDLLRLVDECRRLFEQQPRDNGVSLHLDIGGGVSRVVVGDAQRVRQVLVDLLACAFRYTTRGTVMLRASALPQAGWIRFEVELSGGVPIEMPRLFDLFPALPVPVGGSRSGTGIGLAICRELVQSMGGRIDGSTIPGGNTVFWCELPLHAAVEGN